MSTGTDEELRARLRELADVPVASADQIELAVVGRYVRRRRRRRLILSGCGVATVIAAVAAFQLVPDDPSRELTVTSGAAESAPPLRDGADDGSLASNGSGEVPAAASVEGIEIHTGLEGGEDVVFIFDRQFPNDQVTFVPDIKDFDSPGVAYTVQDTSEILVCGTRHFGFGEGATTGSIDVLIPSEWWTSGAPVHDVPYAYDPPLESVADSVVSPGKIVGCGPYDGYIQYSIWAPASDDPEDIQVSWQDDSTRLVVRVRP